MVDGCCRVVGHEDIWALGDCAEVPQPRGSTYAPTGQNAVREGKLVARNIVAKLRGQPVRRFTYRPIGRMALIGKRTGVADIFGFRFSGLPAWALWRAAYLAEMPGVAKRAQVLMDWLLDLMFGIEIADLPLSPRGLKAKPTEHERRPMARSAVHSEVGSPDSTAGMESSARQST